MNKAKQTVIVMTIICSVCLFTIFAMTYIRDRHDKDNFIAGNFVLLDELIEDPNAYDGQLIAIICYLWPGMEGMGVCSMPTSKRFTYDDKLGKNVFMGKSISAKNIGEYWNFTYGSDSYKLYQDGQKLVIVEGYFRKDNPDSRVYGIAATPLIEVIRSRPLLTAGGQTH